MNQTLFQCMSQILEYMKRTGNEFKILLIINIIISLISSSVNAQEPLSLDNCIKMALENNPEIRNAKRHVSIARTLKTSAFSAYLPSLNAGLNSSQTRVAPQINNRVVYQGIELSEGAEYESPGFITNNYSVGATISQLLFDGGTSINRIRQETANVETALTSEQSTRSKTVLKCKRLFYEIRRVEEQILIAQQSFDSTIEQLSQVELLMKISKVPQMDIYRARVARNNSKITLLNLKPQLEKAIADLNIFMGRSADTPLNLDPHQEVVLPLSYTVENARDFALDNNTDIKSLKQLIIARQRGVAAVKGEFLPRFNITGSYYRYNSSFDNVYGRLNRNYYLYFGISASYNLFDGLRRESSLQRESLKLSLAKENFEAATKSVVENIKNIINRHEMLLETLKLQEESTFEASEALRVVRNGYSIGQATLLDVIEAEKSLVTTEFQRINSHYDVIINQAEFEALLGKTVNISN